jgi:hypothetical protein
MINQLTVPSYNLSSVTHLNKKSNKIITIRNYFIVILLLLFETSPFFLLEIKQNFWFIIFIILLLLNWGSKKIINSKVNAVLMFVWILILLQSIVYGGGFTPAAFYKPIWIFYTPFLVFILMGYDYLKYLYKIIFFIAVYTTIIYLLHTFIGSFNQWLFQAFETIFPYSWADWPRTILIYSAPRDSGYFFMRNSGIFHEPGAYSIYLMMGMIINTYYTNKPFNIRNIFLALIVLTTFSTSGYLMLFLFTSYGVLKVKIPAVLKPIIIIPTAIVLIYVYQNTKFLKQKVDSHYTTQIKEVEEEDINQRGRFYAFGMSIRSFLSNPISGRGILFEHKYEVGKLGSFGYGFAGLFAMYGIFFGLFYMWKFYKGFAYFNEVNSTSALFVLTSFITINMGLLTQVYFFHTPFTYFFLIGLLSHPSSSSRYLRYE